MELVTTGTSKNKVAQQFGISRSALSHWLSDPKGSAGGSKVCPVPFRPTPAYAALFGYYLGDGHISHFPRYSALRIACDARHVGIIRDVEQLMHDVHPDRPTFRVPAPGTIIVQSNWKHWPCVFPQSGPGRKHERKLVMTDWQQQVVVAHPGPFLRGLFHSDGSLVKNWATRMVAGEKKRYELPAVAVRQRVQGHHAVVPRGTGAGRGPLPTDQATSPLGLAPRRCSPAHRADRREELTTCSGTPEPPR